MSTRPVLLAKRWAYIATHLMGKKNFFYMNEHASRSLDEIKCQIKGMQQYALSSLELNCEDL